MDIWRFALADTTLSPIVGQHDLALMLLSFLVILVASFVVALIIPNIQQSKQRNYRTLWISSASIALGVGIWAMHFIAMIALNLPVTIQYDTYFTLLSIPPAIAGSSLFLSLLTQTLFNKQAFILSVLGLALGVGSMHFLGMEAITETVQIHYPIEQFIGVILGIVFLASITLYSAFYYPLSKIISALIMAICISSMHYTGMSIAQLYALPNTLQSTNNLLTPYQLSSIIAGTSLFILLLLACARLISARIQDIKASSDQFSRAVIDNSAEGIITINAEAIVLSFNHSAEAMFGYQADEIIGKNINRLMPKEARVQHDNYVKSSQIHAPQVINVARDLTALRKNGDLFPIELNIAPMSLNGKKIFIGILHDISLRKQQEQQIAASQARFEQLTLLSSDWVWETDQQHNICFLSESFQQLTGWPLETFLGKPREKVSIYDLNDNNWNDYTAVLAQQQPLRHFKFTLKNTHDELIYMIISGDPNYTEQGDFLGYRGTGSDITDITLAKKNAEKANLAKSQFLSSMSHELRTPLNAILGFSQLMTDDPDEPLSEEQQDSMQHITNSGNHLLTLINEILDLSKIESGHINLSLEPVPILDLLNECISLITPFAETHQIDLIQENNVAEATNIYADFTRTKQVILNLLSNAIKYNKEKGQVTLKCSLEAEKIRISITDTGLGISPKQQTKVFSPFERLGLESSNIEGTGIGLVVCKELMEKMHGTIDFKSELNEGSCFWIELPLSQADTTTAVVAINESETKQRATLDQLSGTVLYIEDNPTNLHLMAKVIDRYSRLTLISAHTAEIGISLAYKKEVRLVLMDINLPGISGIEALQVLRENPNTQDIPVIAVSAEATQNSIKKGLAAGFNHYLSKPILIPEIQNILEEFCSDLPS